MYFLEKPTGDMVSCSDVALQNYIYNHRNIPCDPVKYENPLSAYSKVYSNQIKCLNCGPLSRNGVFWMSRARWRTGKRLLTASLAPKLPRLEKPPPAPIHWAAPLQCVEIQLIHQPISIKPMTLVLPGSICAPNLNVTWKKRCFQKKKKLQLAPETLQRYFWS